MDIVYSIDNNFIPQAAALTASICQSAGSSGAENGSESFVFHILSNGITEENQKKFREFTEKLGSQVFFYDLGDFEGRLEKLLGKKPETGRFVKAALGRIFIPEYLPASIRKYLYLDADMIARGDISPLFSLPLHGHILAAAAEPTIYAECTQVAGDAGGTGYSASKETNDAGGTGSGASKETNDAGGTGSDAGGTGSDASKETLTTGYGAPNDAEEPVPGASNDAVKPAHGASRQLGCEHPTVGLSTLMSYSDVGVKSYFRHMTTRFLRATRFEIAQNIRSPLVFLRKNGYLLMFCGSQNRQLGCEHPTVGLSTLMSYFNTGALLVDRDAWEKNDTTRKCLAWYARNNGSFQFADQDIINHVLAGKILPLHQKWNFQTNYHYQSYASLVKRSPWFHALQSETEYETARKLPAIVHFAGDERPWIRGNHNPYRREFESALALTPWKDMPLKSGKEAYMQFYHLINLLSSALPGFREVVSKIYYRTRVR